MSGANLMNPSRFILPFIVQNFLVTKVEPEAASIVLVKPSGVEEGHLMVAFIAKDDDQAITPPAGWTEIETGTDGSTFRFTAWWKQAGGSEPADYTFTGDTEEWIGAIVRITGQEPDDPINLSGVATGNDTTPQCPDILTWADDCIILRAFGADDDDITVDVGYPAGHTGLFVDASGVATGGEASGGVAHKDQATKGATSTADFVLDNSEAWAAMTVAISKANRVWPGNYFGSGDDGKGCVQCELNISGSMEGSLAFHARC